MLARPAGRLPGSWAGRKARWARGVWGWVSVALLLTISCEFLAKEEISPTRTQVIAALPLSERFGGPAAERGKKQRSPHDFRSPRDGREGTVGVMERCFCAAAKAGAQSRGESRSPGQGWLYRPQGLPGLCPADLLPSGPIPSPGAAPAPTRVQDPCGKRLVGLQPSGWLRSRCLLLRVDFF